MTTTKPVEEDVLRMPDGREIKSSIDLSQLTEAGKELYIGYKRKEKQCYIAPSIIGGKGLYILEEVEEGGIVVEYTGRRFEGDEFEKEEKKDKEKYMHEEYLITTDNGITVIDGSVEEASYAKYANHSCSPNCEFVCVGLPSKEGIVRETVFIQALREIELFEELLVGYNMKVDTKEAGIPCRCRSPNCKGVIGTVRNVKGKNGN